MKKVIPSGRLIYKKANSAQLIVHEKFAFGVKTLEEISPVNNVSTLVLSENSHLEVTSAAIGRGSRIKLGAHAKLQIGRNTYLADNNFISISTELSIGDDCAISWDVQMIDDDGHFIGDKPKSAPITIGDHVWIGSRVTLLKGTQIGSGSVVAAGAVVSGVFPPKSMIGGVPAQIIRDNVEWR